MAWVAVTKQGREFISMCKPIRVTDEDNYYGWKDTFTEISLCSGSINKLIGRELSFSDDPVELKQIEYGQVIIIWNSWDVNFEVTYS